MSLRGYLFLKLKTAKSRVPSVPKKPRVTTVMNSQHVTVSKTMPKSATQNFFSYFLIIQKENQLKTFCFSSI